MDEKSNVAAHIEAHLEPEMGHLANAQDAALGRWSAIKKYPMAFAWSMFAVWLVLLVSFENQASGTVLGIPEFRKDFGEYFDGDYVINDVWQGAITGAPTAW